MLTKLDCYYSCQNDGSAGESACSFVILNPMRQAGALVAACSVGAQDSIGSQVAARLAIEHFVEGVLEHFSQAQLPSDSTELATSALEAAFRRANTSVYSFGHKLAAGGRMGASLLGLVITQDFVAGGRAGPGSVYLMRNREIFPFFTPRDGAKIRDAHAEFVGPEQLVGAHSLVAVELASVPLEHEDKVFLFSSLLDANAERRLIALADTPSPAGENPVEYVNRRIAPGHPNAFSLLVELGPKAIYLDQAIR